jgi:hypothetical protein
MSGICSEISFSCFSGDRVYSETSIHHYGRVLKKNNGYGKMIVAWAYIK